MKILERLNNTELELSGLNRWLGKKTFRRTTFYESLAGMIRDGTPVMRALEFICDVETDFGKKKGQSGLYFLATDCIASIR
ncbi:type II secretion protein F, partial [Escherichia coli]|nr:type II secretion protein F [Escherichia coli]